MAEEQGGSPPQPDVSSDHSKLSQLWSEHHTPIMIGIAAVTMLLTAVLVFRRQGSQQQGTISGGQQTLGASGVPTAQTSDSSSAYTNLTNYMQQILQQLQQLGQGGSSGGPTPPPPPPPPGNGGGPIGGIIGRGGILPKMPIDPSPPTDPNPPSPPPQIRPPAPTPEQFVTVGTWTPNPVWNSTLWGIANHEGMSLTRLEQLNPQVSNPDLIYPNEKIRVS